MRRKDSTIRFRLRNELNVNVRHDIRGGYRNKRPIEGLLLSREATRSSIYSFTLRLSMFPSLQLVKLRCWASFEKRSRLCA